jgi:hypothetical protein
VADKLFGQSPTEDQRARALRELNEALQKFRTKNGADDGQIEEPPSDMKK